ncbi:hypothetical protein HanRHA438_Chr15g0686421 [Helianthus annuus]|nr:hypothetical protein HanHA300_Chr15g0550321 [Helianthus annuus]KAJ0471609.1 hypothetical protein HanHA89_Chr15g0597971 [Helianthus annuus]KAJ0647237.1 hypothetical protein HanLR1_Chr15g0559631 [Helianthus annuus]KAJ0842992.1 hypothetical protein HanRHA438_Chr15g0686421 [Helianthus annuus]
MKFSAAKLINTDTTETGSRPPAPGIGVGGCATYDTKRYFNLITNLFFYKVFTKMSRKN